MTEHEESTDAVKSVPRMRYLLWTIPLIIAGMGMGGFGLTLVGDYIARQREEAPRPRPVVIAVKSYELREETFPLRVEATGFLESPATIKVAAEVQGVLRRTMPKEGDPVVEGSVLAEIDDELYRARLEAGRAREKAALARRSFLEKELVRVRDLVSSDSLGESELDRIISELDSVKARLEEAAAAITEAGIYLDKCRLKAPRDGFWYEDLAEEGEYLLPGQPVGQLRVLDHLELEVEVSGSTRLVLTPGESVEVELLDVDPTLSPLTGKLQGAVIDRLPSGYRLPSRRFPVIIRIPNPQLRLLPGLFARVRFTLPRTEPLLLLPKECVFDRFGKTSVYVLEALVEEETDSPMAPDHTALVRYIEVRPLRDRPESWHVAEGLVAGEKVARSPIEQLLPGSHVREESTP